MSDKGFQFIQEALSQTSNTVDDFAAQISAKITSHILRFFLIPNWG